MRIRCIIQISSLLLFFISPLANSLPEISVSYDTLSHMIHVHLLNYRDEAFCSQNGLTFQAGATSVTGSMEGSYQGNLREDDDEQEEDKEKTVKERIQLTSKKFMFLGKFEAYIQIVISSENVSISLLSEDDTCNGFKFLNGVIFERRRISARGRPEICRKQKKSPTITKGLTGFVCLNLCKTSNLNRQTDQEVFHIRPIFDGRWTVIEKGEQIDTETYLWEILKSDMALLKRGGMDFCHYFEEKHYISIGNDAPFMSETAQLSFWASQDGTITKTSTVAVPVRKKKEKEKIAYEPSQLYKKVSLAICRAGGRYDDLHSMSLSGWRAPRYKFTGETGINCLDRFDDAAGRSSPLGMTTCFKVTFEKKADGHTSDQRQSGVELQEMQTANTKEADSPKKSVYAHCSNDHPKIFDLTQAVLTATYNSLADAIHLQLLNFKQLESEDIILSEPFHFKSRMLKIGVYPRGNSVNTDHLIIALYQCGSDIQGISSLSGFCINHQRLTARDATDIHQCYARHQPRKLTEDFYLLAEIPVMKTGDVYYTSNHEEFTIWPVYRSAATKATSHSPFTGSTGKSSETGNPEIYCIKVNRTRLAMAKRGLYLLQSEPLGLTGLHILLGNTSKTALGQDYTHCSIGLKGRAEEDREFSIGYLAGEALTSEVVLWKGTLKKSPDVDIEHSKGRITELMDKAHGHDITMVVRLKKPETRKRHPETKDPAQCTLPSTNSRPVTASPYTIIYDQEL